MAKVNGTGLAYRSDVADTWIAGDVDDMSVVNTTRSIYEMWAANRIVFLVSVVNADPDLVIQLGKPDADVTGEWHLSRGKAAKAVHAVPAADGSDIPDGLDEHVDGITVQSYVYPRAALILTHMYGLGVVPSE